MLQRSPLAAAGLILIQVHILKRTWTNDQILFGINTQARLLCILLEELSYFLISFVVAHRQQSHLVTSYPIAGLYQEGAYGALERQSGLESLHRGGEQQTLLSEYLCVVLCAWSHADLSPGGL